MKLRKNRITSGSEFEEKIGYSRAVIDGDHLLISGTTGYDYKTMSISDDVVEQAEQCFKNIEDTLRTASCGFAQVLRVRYILTNRADFERCWPVFNRYLGGVKPAATAIIAGLVDEKMKIEIEVTARHLISDD